jgi:GTP cyclohydrolase I
MNTYNNALKQKINGNKDNYHEFLRIIGDNHATTSINTPLRKEAFEADDNAKIAKIAWYFEEIMNTLGLDLSDDSLKGTPLRVAKMYVQEIFSGLNPDNKPDATLFDNKFHYNQMLVEKDIKVHSYCEHHFVPIIGKAHVAYIANKQVIGLSKINRIVDYFARRPQVQERLTVQIAEDLKKVLNTEDVAVVIEAEHMCVAMRGVKDHGSSTTTSSFNGKFLEADTKNEFLKYVYSGKIN